MIKRESFAPRILPSALIAATKVEVNSLVGSVTLLLVKSRSLNFTHTFVSVTFVSVALVSEVFLPSWASAAKFTASAPIFIPSDGFSYRTNEAFLAAVFEYFRLPHRAAIGTAKRSFAVT